MIERTIAWLIAKNNRRLRYRGIERNQLGWSHRCAAINLKRLLNLGLDHDTGWTITTPTGQAPPPPEQRSTGLGTGSREPSTSPDRPRFTPRPRNGDPVEVETSPTTDDDHNGDTTHRNPDNPLCSAVS